MPVIVDQREHLIDRQVFTSANVVNGIPDDLFQAYTGSVSVDCYVLVNHLDSISIPLWITYNDM